MAAILHSIQVMSALVLIGLILLQRTQGDMGSSLGDSASIFQTRRGAERFLFVLTVIVAVAFAAASIGVFAFA